MVGIIIKKLIKEGHTSFENIEKWIENKRLMTTVMGFFNAKKGRKSNETRCDY